jgi:hypothetical protein
MKTFLNAMNDLPPGCDPGERPEDASRRTHDGGHRFGCSLGQRDQDAPAAGKEFGETGLGSGVLGPGDRMVRDKVAPGGT